MTTATTEATLRQSQCSRLLAYMQTHSYVTCLDGFRKLGIVSFPRRILDLKRQGFKIDSDWVVVKNRYKEECRVKRYKLVRA